MGRRRRERAGSALTATLVAGFLVAGCGGTSQVDQVKSAVVAFVHDVGHHSLDACREVTPAFWSGFAQDINGNLAKVGGSISTRDCQTGLRQLFKAAGSTPIVRSGVSLTDVTVHGNSASGREEIAGSVAGPLELIKQHGAWRISCCAGQQREQQPQTSYRVPSPSMEPTLHPGQIVVSDNASLRAHPPPLGAIVLFHPPAGADPMSPACGAPDEGAGFARPCGKPTEQESTQTFIKRIVGLPGDRIAVVNGRVIRNGRPEPRPYRVGPCTAAQICSFPKPVTIPANEYFVLGDNLGASDDSRFWGPVKRTWLIGIVKTP